LIRNSSFNHGCTEVGNPREWCGFWPNSFRGVLGAAGKYLGIPLFVFYDQVLITLPPSPPPPMCIYGFDKYCKFFTEMNLEAKIVEELQLKSN
jgi:hypothetical protein